MIALQTSRRNKLAAQTCMTGDTEMAGESDAVAVPPFEFPAQPRRRALLRGAVGLGIAAGGGLLPGLALAGQLTLGQQAPPLVLHTLDGPSIATRDLLGQVVVVTFWATWCGPCIEEMPLLSAYAARHARQGLSVLGFSLDGPQDLSKVRAMAAGLSFPVGLLGSPWAGAYGRIWRIPVSFVIDRAGRLVDNGWDDAEPVWSKDRLRRVLDPLLAQSA